MDVGHYILDGNADAVEFCPHESCSDVLAASTYVLQEGDEPRRSGSISLFNVNADAGLLELIQTVETAGIFDVKWSPRLSSDSSLPLLAQADADGYVRIYSLQCRGSDGSQIKENCLSEVCGQMISSSMCLYIDWNPSGNAMAVGRSDGSVSVVSLDESRLSIRHDWKAHDFEVWAASFDIQQPTLVYTGSDDCKFACWDIRDDPSKLVFQNSKAHKMGVCCVAKSPGDSNTLLTGSYDEHLRIWDVRSMSKPVVESSICLGGGIWRIKHHPSRTGRALAACMHNGFAIVRFESDKIEVVETYNKHGSLAYGADWQRGTSPNLPVIATCSFYDRLLRVWTPKQ
ncbi:uncharacterized protein LOC127240417 [Andrographis paniculata]|uniref:uncharacterized protein LOC127240417 n=1 Tax=Andrographis paniculata TaxID=175694 RepID=UPI0021E7A221|nr:uncharacterized protein LOC127240417 [Andrographis paniculata]